MVNKGTIALHYFQIISENKWIVPTNCSWLEGIEECYLNKLKVKLRSKAWNTMVMAIKMILYKLSYAHSGSRFEFGDERHINDVKVTVRSKAVVERSCRKNWHWSMHVTLTEVPDLIWRRPCTKHDTIKPEIIVIL